MATTTRPRRPTSNVAALGLGSNLGDSEARLREAIRDLREVLQPLHAASLFRTRPLGDQPQPPYLNTAVVGCPLLPPEELLAVAKALELAAGRRSGPRHAPRRLDVDLLVYGDLSSDRPELTLPHPGLRYRRFVLAPPTCRSRPMARRSLTCCSGSARRAGSNTSAGASCPELAAGLVVIFIVLEAIGRRGPQVEIIVGAMLAIDRPLDMYRTAINIFGDSCGAAIIARSEGETEVDRVPA